MLVNTSRGAVIDTAAVIRGLKSGQIGALGLDVYEEESQLFFEDLSDRNGLLISIEPLIDMGRTALNVSGSITAGTVTSRLMGETDMHVFNSDHEVSLDGEESTV